MRFWWSRNGYYQPSLQLKQRGEVMKDAIIVNNLTRKFGNFTAVHDLTMNIAKGEVCAFLGPNGAGKTTTVRMLCGILAPTSGTAVLLGYDLMKETDSIKAHLGYMSQKFSLYDDLTAQENLDFYAGLYNIPAQQRKKRISSMLDLAGLSERHYSLASTLSRGLKQRLALGCAIIADPDLVFLDEPTSGVSPGSRRAFFDIIQNLAAQGKTIIVTTHFMDEAERCDRIAFFNQGRLLALDTPDYLKKNVLQGHLVAITTPDPVGLMDNVEALPYVRDCSLHGVNLHVLLESAEAVASLKQATGLEAKAISPNLEDVFIALAKRRKEVE